MVSFTGTTGLLLSVRMVLRSGVVIIRFIGTMDLLLYALMAVNIGTRMANFTGMAGLLHCIQMAVSFGTGMASDINRLIIEIRVDPSARNCNLDFDLPGTADRLQPNT